LKEVLVKYDIESKGIDAIPLFSSLIPHSIQDDDVYFEEYITEINKRLRDYDILYLDSLKAMHNKYIVTILYIIRNETKKEFNIRPQQEIIGEESSGRFLDKDSEKYQTLYKNVKKILEMIIGLLKDRQEGIKQAIGLTPACESILVKFNEKVLNLNCTLNNLHDFEKPEKSGGIGMKISGISEISQVSSVCYIDLECERTLASTCIKTKEGKININNKKIAEALISFVTRKLPKATRGPIDIHRWMEEKYYSTVPIPSQELKAEYNELEKFLKDAQSYQFHCWQEREGIKSTPRNVVEIWQQSQVESISASEALSWLVAWEFAKNLHLFTAGLIRQHLTEKEDWIPISLIDYLLSIGWLISITPREIIYSVGQLTLWGDKEGLHKFLTEWADEVIWYMEDYHAQDNELKILKLHMWIKNDITQLLKFHKTIPKTTWENAFAQ
ncbi:2825_t:CDS:2, partial [Ambispora leptoticha]